MNTAFFKNLLSLISSCVLLCFGFRETTESGDSDAFLKNDHGSQAETTGGSHAATAGGSLAATAGKAILQQPMKAILKLRMSFHIW